MNNKITTICIPTCNRPESLHNAIVGIIENLNKYNRNQRILIVDDSDNIDSANKSKEICSSFANSYSGNIECIDRRDREEMIGGLVEKSGLSEELIRFTVCGDKVSKTTLGSVRNTFLLKTLGEKILITDDDVMYNFLSPIEKKNPFFSVENPNKHWFLMDEEKPSSSNFISIETDFLSEHENVLGKNAFDILGKNTPDYIEQSEIIDTYMGFYGDSPMESHIPLLLLPEIQEQLKNISFDEYSAMKKRGRMIRTSPSLVVYQGILCISMIMGIDNRELVPPFLPVARGNDLIFGATRWKAFPSKLSAYIPLLIGHERPNKEIRSVSYDSVREMTKTNRIITSFIEEIDDVDIDPYNNLNIIGNKFINIANEPIQIFQLLMETQCQKITRTSAEYIDNILQTTPGIPDFWVKDMEAIINDLNSPDPRKFMYDITKDYREDRMIILQKWIGFFGQLLQGWDKLIQ